MIEEPTADEIMTMFATDIAVLRRGRRKPSTPSAKKKTATVPKKQSTLTPEQIERKRERSRQWKAAHRSEVLAYNRRYKRAHRPVFHHLSREEQAAYKRNYYLLHPEKRRVRRREDN